MQSAFVQRRAAGSAVSTGCVAFWAALAAPSRWVVELEPSAGWRSPGPSSGQHPLWG